MPPKRDLPALVEDLILALSDKRVLDALGGVFENKLQSVLQTVSALETANKQLENNVKSLENELQTAHEKINSLENYNRIENLVITGLPLVDYSDAASTNAVNSDLETSLSTERAVLDLVSTHLNVPITAADISIAHRLRKKPSDPAPARVIVRFTNRRIRNAVYAARRQLKSYNNGNGHKIFINEDLTHETAEVFRQARQLVKQKSIFSCWTTGGVVYIKKTPERECKPVRLTLSSDISRMCC